MVAVLVVAVVWVVDMIDSTSSWALATIEERKEWSASANPNTN